MLSFLVEGSGKHKWVPLSIDPPPSSRPPPSRGGHPRDRDRYRGETGERYHREGGNSGGGGGGGERGERYKDKDGEYYAHRDRDREGYRWRTHSRTHNSIINVTVHGKRAHSTQTNHFVIRTKIV